MKSTRLMRFGVVFLILMVVMTASAFSTKWYVNSTNGDDFNNNGQNPVQLAGPPFPQPGPYITLGKAMAVALDGDTVSVAAGTYGALTGEVNVVITHSVTIISTTYLSSNVVTISDGVTMNGSGKSANLGRAIDGSLQFSLGNTTPATALTLTAGTLNVDANVTIVSGGTTTRTDGALAGSPTTANLNVIYGVATGDLVAGTEMPASLGTGSLTVGNTGHTVTIPSSVALTSTGAVLVTGTSSATFNGSISAAQGSITNSGTGTLAILGSVTFAPTTGNAPGAVVNSNTGTLTVAGPLTVLVQNVNAGTTVNNSNAGAGTLTLSGGAVFTEAATADPGGNFTASITNIGTGTLTVAGVTVNSATYTGPVTRTIVVSAVNTSATGVLTFSAPVALTGTLTNTAAGQVNLAGGTVTGNVANNGGGNIALNANTAFAGDLSNNNAASVIQLNSSILTLSKVGAVYTANAAAKIISAAAATVGSGILSITNGCATLQGELPNVNISSASTISAAAHLYGTLIMSANTTISGATTIERDLSITGGTLAVAAATEVKGATAMGGTGITLTAGLTADGVYSQTAGVLTLNNQTFTAKNNVTMTGGTVAAGTGNILLNSGSAPQTFTPIPNLSLYDLTVTSAGQIVTLGASVIITHNVAITAGTLELSTYNVRMQGASGLFNNATGYTSSGGGTLIFEAAGTISGAGTFSNLDIRTGGATYVQMGSDITFSGNLYLRSGDLDINANDLTLSNVLVRPSILKNVAPTAGTANIVDIATGGSILFAAGTDYDLTWFGDANWASGSFASEWQPTKLHNLTVSTGTGTRTVTVPAAAIAISGNLTVSAGQTLALNGQTLTAGTASAAHSIVGTVSGGTIDLTGNSETITGAATTVGAAAVNNLSINGTNVVVSNLQTISGNLVVNKAGANITMNTTSAVITGNVTVATTAAADAVTLNMVATTSTMSGNLVLTNGALTLTRGAAGQQTIVGTSTLTAGSLILGSDIDVTGTTAQANGHLVLNAFNYTANGAYTRTGTGNVTGTGKLVINNVALTPGTSLSVPNLEFKGAGASTAAAMTVSNTLIQTAGATTLGGDLTLSGTALTFTAGSFAGAGKLVFTGATGSTITAAAAMSVNGGMTINTADTITFRSSAEATPTPRTFTSVGAFAQTVGTVDLGINTLQLQGSFTRVLGSWLMGTGQLQLAASAPPTAATPGVGFAIKNLTITNAATFGTTDAFTVTNLLKVGAALTLNADGKLVIASGATIDITNAAGILSKIPSFPVDNNVTITYDATLAAGTGKELPAIAQNINVNAATTLTADVTVLGELAIDAALNAVTNTKTVTMGGGATLVMYGGSLDKAVVPTGGLNLEYAGVSSTSSFDWPATANIASLIISASVDLHANRTVQGTTTLDAGIFDLSGYTLTTLGDVIYAGGTMTGGTWTITGNAPQTLTLPGTLVVPMDIRFDLATDTSSITIVGGDLDFATNDQTLYLDRGVVNTGTQKIILQRSVDIDDSFVQTDGVVVGTVRYDIHSGDGAAGSPNVFIYPLGTLTAEYRPITIAFAPDYAAMSNAHLDLAMIDQSPGGSKNLPVTESPSLKIGGYPNFYWLATATPNMLANQQFDIVLQSSANIGYTYDRPENLRIVRRQDGNAQSNGWTELGDSANYVGGNYIQVVGGDSILYVRSSSVRAQGGIVQVGTILTLGIPTRAPIFTTAFAVDTVAQIDSLELAFIGHAQDIGETVTFSIQPTVAGASIVTTSLGGDSARGALKYKPGFATAPGNVSIKIRLYDGQYTTETTLVVTVLKSNRPPVFTAELAVDTVKERTAINFTYVATDADGDALSYALADTTIGAHVTTAGVFIWTPTFAQAGSSYTVRVIVTDASLAADTSTKVVFVKHSRIKGDVNGSGGTAPISTIDATLILQYVVGIPAGVTALADPAASWAADVSNAGGVTALDAAYILQYLAHLRTLPTTPNILSKAVVACGTLSWGNLTAGEAGAIALPLKVVDASNIYSVQFKANIGSLKFNDLKANLPKDWLISYKAANGVLSVAAAGVTPISDGNIATLSFNVDKDQKDQKVVADVLLNESTSLSISAQVVALPTEFALENNYPNPFNPTTTIKYQLPQDVRVSVTIYNIQGQVVRTLVNEDQKAGFYTIQWDGRSEAGTQVATGIYIYRINAGSFVTAKKMVMMK